MKPCMAAAVPARSGKRDSTWAMAVGRKTPSPVTFSTIVALKTCLCTRPAAGTASINTSATPMIASPAPAMRRGGTLPTSRRVMIPPMMKPVTATGGYRPYSAGPTPKRPMNSAGEAAKNADMAPNTRPAVSAYDTAVRFDSTAP